MEDFIEVVVDPLAMIVDFNGFPSFTSNLGVMCRVVKEGEECNMELTKEQCITSSLITEEGFEASLEDFINALLSARATPVQPTTTQFMVNLPPQAEAVPVASTSNHQPQGAPPARHPLGELNRNSAITGEGVKARPVASSGGVPNGPSPQHLLRDLQDQLTKLFAAKPTKKVPINMGKSEDSAAMPMVWVSKWVDYSDRYGFGYLFNNDTAGVLFNDLTQLLLLVDGKSIQYVERDGTKRDYRNRMEDYPPSMEEKIKLLNYFRNYMSQNLSKDGEAIPTPDGDEMTRLPVVRQWFRTSTAVVMHLTNGTLQVNYFKDHVKTILCPLMGAVTVIDALKQIRTYRLSSLARFGCSIDLLNRLEYASKKIDYILAPHSP